MAHQSLRIGVVQMASADDLAANVERVESLYRDGVTGGAEVVIFPENTLYFRASSQDEVREPSATDLDRISRVVDGMGVPLLLTTAREPRDGRFANATMMFEPGRPARVVYEKIHLFDIQMRGRPPVRESDHFRAGDQPSVIEIAGWHLGLTICYDLRFPELFLRYAQRADVVLVPAAFLVATGRDHWHVLLRARAIETQAFVVAPAQFTDETFGHALVVGPWGDVRLDMGTESGVRVVKLERDDVNKMREQIPMANHRRPC